MSISSLTTPAIGTVWPTQGGHYAGIMRDGDLYWHLILATAPQSVMRAHWSQYANDIPGEFSRRNGMHNTALIVAADPKNTIAAHITKLHIEGHNDFYWPAQYENNLLCINLPEYLFNGWHWSSTQYSARSAWIQGFGDGYQYYGSKENYDHNDPLAVRAVRRILI